jgi:hypothetical protein
VPELIAESGGGFAYEMDEDLVSAMDRLVADRSYRRELGLRAHQAYGKKWTAERHLRQSRALIRGIEAKKAIQRPACSSR